MNSAETATLLAHLDRIATALETIATNTTRRPRRAPAAPAVDPRQLPLRATTSAPIDAFPPTAPPEPARYRWGFNAGTLARLTDEAAAELRTIHPTALAFGTLSRSSSAWWFVDAWTETGTTGARLGEWCVAHKVSPLSRQHSDADDEALRGLKRWTFEEAFAECARIAVIAERNDAGRRRTQRERKTKAATP